jgi:hypothetical protein
MPISARCVSKAPGAQVAQLVEHVTENHGVGGSIPPLGTKLLEFELINPVVDKRCWGSVPQLVPHGYLQRSLVCAPNSPSI